MIKLFPVDNSYFKDMLTEEEFAAATKFNIERRLEDIKNDNVIMDGQVT